MIAWFGKDWNAPVCRDTPHVETPVGQECAWCDEAIQINDRGVVIPRIPSSEAPLPYHIECHLRSIMGSVAHQQRKCSCYVAGSTEDDPPNTTKRQAAILAAHIFQRQTKHDNN